MIKSYLAKLQTTQKLYLPIIEVQLSILSNRLLHGYYWFLILDLMFTTKHQLKGLARSARKREAACMESAITMIS